MLSLIVAVVRRTAFAIVLAIATAALAQSAAASPFPSEGERWLLSVRVPGERGQERFARIYGDPASGGRWSIAVTCGTVSTATGREVVELRATGIAARSRRGDLGWTWTPVSGGPTGGGGITREHDLSPDVVLAAPCPSGVGDLSSGD